MTFKGYIDPGNVNPILPAYEVGYRDAIDDVIGWLKDMETQNVAPPRLYPNELIAIIEDIVKNGYEYE